MEFFNLSEPLSLDYIAKNIDCQIISSSNLENILIKNIVNLDLAGSEDLTFYNNPTYLSSLKNTKAKACIINEKDVGEAPEGLILLVSSNAYFSYSKALDLFYKEYIPGYNISENAHIDKSSVIGKNCFIDSGVVIREGVVIGDNTRIYANSVIDRNVKIGADCIIYENVTIKYAIIGSNSIIHSGTRIGQESFGFATSQGTHHKVKHIGLVIIGKYVEIGANCTIDRGSVNNTIIGDMCKLSNMVQISHNVELGKGCLIVAQVGIAGSTKLGNYCVVGGQAGIAGHLNIGNFVQIAAKSGVIKNIQEKEKVGGFPAVSIIDWHKQSIILKQLTKKSGK